MVSNWSLFRGGHRGQFFGLVGSVGICMLSRNYLPRVLGKQNFHWGLKIALAHTDRGVFWGEWTETGPGNCHWSL